jgi:hypothetical protein
LDAGTRAAIGANDLPAVEHFLHIMRIKYAYHEYDAVSGVELLPLPLQLALLASRMWTNTQHAQYAPHAPHAHPPAHAHARPQAVLRTSVGNTAPDSGAPHNLDEALAMFLGTGFGCPSATPYTLMQVSRLVLCPDLCADLYCAQTCAQTCAHVPRLVLVPRLVRTLKLRHEEIGI